MHEEMLGEYVQKVAEKFGFQGAHYDASNEAILFPNSDSKDDIPETIKYQPTSFFAYLAGALTVGQQHITVQTTDEGTLLKIKGGDSYDPLISLSQESAKLKK